MTKTDKTSERWINVIIMTVIAIVMIVCVLGCGLIDESESDPQVVITSISDCKQPPYGKYADSGDSLTPDRDCIRYRYSAPGVLLIDHYNAGFNCCTKVDTEYELKGDTITITEVELEAECDCLCLYDLSYQISDIDSISYLIRVIEPYVNDQQEILEFNVDLNGETDGFYYVTRNFYPWLEQ